MFGIFVFSLIARWRRSIVEWHERKELAESAFSSTSKVSSTGYKRVDCPFCTEGVGKVDTKQCLSLHVASGFYRCWRCGSKGRIGEGQEDWQPPAEAAEHKIEPPEGYLPLTEEPALSAMSADEPRAYLRGRGLADERIWAEARIGVCLAGRMEGHIIVPVLDLAGVWVGWVGRAWVKKAERPYHNAPGMTFGSVGGLYNQAALDAPSPDPVLVMEGVFDALAVWPEAVAVLGKPTDAQVNTLSKARRSVVVVLDGDAAREGAAIAYRLRLMGQTAGAVRLPPGKDPDEVDREWLMTEARRSLNQWNTWM